MNSPFIGRMPCEWDSWVYATEKSNFKSWKELIVVELCLRELEIVLAIEKFPDSAQQVAIVLQNISTLEKNMLGVSRFI